VAVGVIRSVRDMKMALTLVLTAPVLVSSDCRLSLTDPLAPRSN
jgi:hypothetical protein